MEKVEKNERSVENKGLQDDHEQVVGSNAEFGGITYRHVGKIREAHGLKGDLYVLIFSRELAWRKQMKTFLLRKKGSMIPCEVELSKPHKLGMIVKVKGVESRNDSEALVGFDFLIPEQLLISRPGERIYLNEIMNFKVKTPQQTDIGQILGFSSNGPQDLLVVQLVGSEKKVEIPLVDAFLKKIDFSHKYLLMDLPEGLIEV